MKLLKQFWGNKPPILQRLRKNLTLQQIHIFRKHREDTAHQEVGNLLGTGSLKDER